MGSIDALARAIKEYEGGVVIVSHDFRTFPPLVVWICNVQLPSLGLISQVANELWEVKGRKIRNLTREDVGIVEYKKMLVQKSTFQGSLELACQLTDKNRFRRFREGKAVQQNRYQGQDINVRDGPAFVRLAYRTLLYLLYDRHVLRVFRFHHHRLDCVNALVHVFYTKKRRICGARISTLQIS